MPRTLLARTFLLLALLVLLTTAAWLSLFRYIDAEPRARETAQLAASAVNLIRAALFAAAPAKRPALLADYASREGIRLLPAEPEDRVQAMEESRFVTLLKRELAARLGERTRLAASVDDVPGFWVSFRLDEEDEEEYWLVLQRHRAERRIAQHWLTWGLLAIALALAVAWLIASRISRPLKAMAASAEAVGRGRIPEPLPVGGADELARLASAFNAMARDLERHDRDRSEVLAGISHDLRTPLTRLRLEAEMSIADESARQAVIADIEQMEAVISQFMDYARGDAGETPVMTDPAVLLANVAARQSSIGRALATDIGALPEMPLRAKALTRAVTNLLDNAWKYGGGNVVLRAGLADKAVQIDVIDHGPGIPPAEIDRMKRPFTRLEDARTDAGGTGLGLAIVDRVARLHGGRLDLLPAPDGGLLARLRIPLARACSQ